MLTTIAEIGTLRLPTFFLVTSQAGVKSMTLSLNGAQERVVGPNRAIVQCATAMWTFRYHNGYTVALRGPFTAHVAVPVTHDATLDVSLVQPAPSSTFTLKIDHIQFDSNVCEKHVAVDVIGGNHLSVDQTLQIHNASTPIRTFTRYGAVAAPPLQQPQPLQVGQRDEERCEPPRITYERAFIPADPVNAFGIPQATMGCLEVGLPISTNFYLYSDPRVLNTEPILTQSDTSTIQLHGQHSERPRDIRGDLEETVGIVEPSGPEQLPVLGFRVPFLPSQRVSLYSKPDWYLTH